VTPHGSSTTTSLSCTTAALAANTRYTVVIAGKVANSTLQCQIFPETVYSLPSGAFQLAFHNASPALNAVSPSGAGFGTFANSSPPTKTESEQQFSLSFLWFLGNIKLYLLSICAAVTFTILLVSGNTIAMSVRERIKEVGVLKTLGFTNDTILGIIIGEAITISLIGGVIGLILATGLTIFVGKAGQAFVGQLHGLSITWPTALIALGVAVFIGLVSSFVPAWNAARTNILDSLRYSG